MYEFSIQLGNSLIAVVIGVLLAFYLDRKCQKLKWLNKYKKVIKKKLAKTNGLYTNKFQDVSNEVSRYEKCIQEIENNLSKEEEANALLGEIKIPKIL